MKRQRQMPFHEKQIEIREKTPRQYKPKEGLSHVVRVFVSGGSLNRAAVCIRFMPVARQARRRQHH
jgi:hypothetical protein